jgi:putative flippase GtrA
MQHKFAIFMGWIVGLSIFGGWMSIVGNPHVVETSIGIVIALVGGFWIFFKIAPETDL